MGLKFLEPDDKVGYIHEEWSRYSSIHKAAHGLYKKGDHPALLVVDIQKGYTSPDTDVGTKHLTPEVRRWIDEAISNTQRLLDGARKIGLPVFYTGTKFRAGGSDSGVRGETNTSFAGYMRDGQPWTEIDERVSPKPGDHMVWKTTNSAFFDTSLANLLTGLGVDTCVFTGMATSGCVRATVTDAVSHNFRSVVVEDCVFDRSTGPHKASLFDIWFKLGDVVTLSEMLGWFSELQLSKGLDGRPRDSGDM